MIGRGSTIVYICRIHRLDGVACDSDAVIGRFFDCVAIFALNLDRDSFAECLRRQSDKEGGRLLAEGYAIGADETNLCKDCIVKDECAADSVVSLAAHLRGEGGGSLGGVDIDFARNLFAIIALQGYLFDNLTVTRKSDFYPATYIAQ